MDPRELTGVWSLRRILVDRRTATTGRVTGLLTLQRTTRGLRWSESGQLSWLGQTLPVSRVYGLAEEADGWWMTFEDGRRFHPWRPGERVVHDCAADVYRGVVDVTPSRLRTVWDVTGPTKSQRIVTRFQRSG
jgi:hypothetical protein